MNCSRSRRCVAVATASRWRGTPAPEERRRLPGRFVHSLSRRLLVSVSLPLALFFGVMMLVLDSSFRALSEHSLHELLDAQMVSLIAAADPLPEGGYAPPPQALEARLATPRSGLYAQIRSGEHQWLSPSTVGAGSDFGALLKSGARTFSYA